MYGFEIFHENMMKTLIHSVQEESCAHAYLFTGAKGLGKHEAARLLAMAMACYTIKSAPCGTCPACVQAKSNSNPDIVHIRTGEKKSISVESIRQMTKDAYIKPFAATKKVYIIDEADSMTEQAQNAFLKLLEEPPAYAVFILVAENEAALLETILSRCMTVRFSPVADTVIDAYVREKYPDEADRCTFLVRYAKGIPGNVDRVVDMPDFEELRQAAAQKIPALLSRHTISAYAISDFLEDNKDNADLIFDFWLDFLRDALLCEQGCPTLVVNQDLQDKVKKVADSFAQQNVIFALERVIEAKNMLSRHVKLQAIALNLSFSIKKALYSS